jgi:hypothetical protein
MLDWLLWPISPYHPADSALITKHKRAFRMRATIAILAVSVWCLSSLISAAGPLTQPEQDAMVTAAMKRRSDELSRLDGAIAAATRSAKRQHGKRFKESQAHINGLTLERENVARGRTAIFNTLSMPLKRGDVGVLPDERIEVENVLGSNSIVARFYDASIKPDPSPLVVVSEPRPLPGVTFNSREGQQAIVDWQRSGAAANVRPAAISPELNASIVVIGVNVDDFQARHKYMLGRVLRVKGTNPLAGVMGVEVINTDAIESKYRELCQTQMKDVPETKKATTPVVKSHTPAPVNYESLLKNAHKLIDAKIYAGAEKTLRRIIDEAPGTESAKEAQKELDALPAH